MQELLSLPEPPDAVFCYNDLSAIAADAAMQAGLRIPQDMAFIGCGVCAMPTICVVPLTSVDRAPEVEVWQPGAFWIGSGRGAANRKSCAWNRA
jgi:DNA-binding LacI/PurR family transcriptional regulator